MSVARIRVPAGFAVAAIVFYLATPTPVSILAGLPVAILGLVFRATAAGIIRKNDALAEDGPYRYTRNPLYFGSFLLAAGFAVMSANLASTLILTLPFYGIYSGVIRREEQDLAARFGNDFDRFRDRVPAFFPHRLGKEMLTGFSVDQFLRNREYNAALGFGAALAIFLYKALG